MEFLDQDIICSCISRIPKKFILKELKENKLRIMDVRAKSPKIEILIGSDYFRQLLTSQEKRLKSGLTAIQTKLGWTLCASLECISEYCLNYGNMLITNLTLKDMQSPEFSKFQTIGITEPSQTLSKAEDKELAHDDFIKEVGRNREGRYVVGLL